MGDINYCAHTYGCYCMNKNQYKAKLISKHTEMPDNVSDLVCQYIDDDIHVGKISYTTDLLCDTHLQKLNLINELILINTPIYGVVVDIVCGYI